MALTSKKYSGIYDITSGEQTKLEATHAEGHLGYLALHPEDNPFVAGVIKEIKDLQDEIDYLRTEVSANKDKVIPNVTGTANHAISFGALTTTLVKGKPVYSVVMTVTDSSGAKTVSKAITLTLT